MMAVKEATTPKRLSNSIPEAARRLDVSVPYIRKLIRNKQLEAVKFGRVIRIPEEALVAFAKHGTGTADESLN